MVKVRQGVGEGRPDLFYWLPWGLCWKQTCRWGQDRAQGKGDHQQSRREVTRAGWAAAWPCRPVGRGRILGRLQVRWTDWLADWMAGGGERGHDDPEVLGHLKMGRRRGSAGLG